MTVTTYECPRCGYEVKNKTDMRRHFERKRVCKDKNGLVLTPEIMEHVLDNYNYNIPKEPKKSVNYNTMMGILNSMECLDKVKLITDYQKTDIVDFEDDLERKCAHIVHRLENNEPTCSYLLTLDDLFNVVNTCTNRNQGEQERFNVFFDRVINRLKLYRSRTWETYLEDAGIRQLVSLIKSYYLDAYEIYLIKNLHSPAVNGNRWQLKDHLTIYYQFLAVFDLEPYVLTLEDIEILGFNPKENQTNFLSETYKALYQQEKQEQKEPSIKNVKKKIINIIKDNSVQNAKNLDKTIIDLLKIDSTFRDELLKTRELIDSEQLTI